MDYSLIVHNMNQQFSIFKKKCVKIKIKKLQYFLLPTVFIIKFIKKQVFNLKKMKLKYNHSSLKKKDFVIFDNYSLKSMHLNRK